MQRVEPDAQILASLRADSPGSRSFAYGAALLDKAIDSVRDLLEETEDSLFSLSDPDMLRDIENIQAYLEACDHPDEDPADSGYDVIDDIEEAFANLKMELDDYIPDALDCLADALDDPEVVKVEADTGGTGAAETQEAKARRIDRFEEMFREAYGYLMRSCYLDPA